MSRPALVRDLNRRNGDEGGDALVFTWPDSVIRSTGKDVMASNFVPITADTQSLGSASEFASDFYDAVRPMPYFENFGRAECAELCNYLRCYGVTSHTVILREADAGNFMLILLTGKVDVIKQYGSSEASWLASLGPGSLVGELSLVDGGRRHASCVARSPSDFAVLTRKTLNEILSDHPRLGNKLLMVLLKAGTAGWRSRNDQSAGNGSTGPFV